MSTVDAYAASANSNVADALMSARARVECPPFAPDSEIDPPASVTTECVHLVAYSNDNSTVPGLVTENGIQGDAAILTLSATAVPTAAPVTPFNPMRTLVSLTILGA